MTIAYLIVVLVGLGLIATGGVYWVYRERLKSDPILIASCFGSGAFLLASGFISSI